MRIAAIELYVEPRRRRSETAEPDVELVRKALVQDVDARSAHALEAIEVAANGGAEVVVCPGWTFVGRAPRPSALARAAGGATVVFEVLEDEDAARPFALEGGVVRALPPMAFATAGALDGVAPEAPARLAAALRDGRRIGPGLVLVGAEVNAVRRLVRPGERVRYAWDERVAAAGLAAGDLARALVLNPAHAPSGSYVRDKRRAGPWRAIVSTANTLDWSRVRRRPLAPPAHAVLGGKDLAPAIPPVAVGERGSRVVLYDVPAE